MRALQCRRGRPSLRAQSMQPRGPCRKALSTAQGAPRRGAFQRALRGPLKGPPADSVGALPVARG